jgi:ATPase subunit of ABC transporter with duplicated ATPase domains
MIRLDQIAMQHGRQILFLDASMSVNPGDKIGLIGPNGAGKSTIFRLIMREEEPDGGVVVTERGIRIGYFSQDVGEMSGRSVVAETMAGAGEVADVARELHTLEHAMATGEGDLDAIITRYGEVQARFDDLDGYALEARTREILAGLNFSPEMQELDVGAMSGGWKMRVALARILLMKADVLLLDEPTNHLDIESILWLEKFLQGFDGALVMTSHDRQFMNRIISKIVEIDGGDLITWSGNYDFYEKGRAQANLQREAQFARQQAMLAKEEAFIARFKARASHAAQVQSRQKKIDKIEKVEPPRRREIVEFDFRPPPRSGDDVVQLRAVKKAYGSKRIYDGLDLIVKRGERWCIMGVNGAGKSTLLKMVAGETTPDTGDANLGANVKLGYFAQHAMEVLDPNKTVLESLQDSFPRATVGAMKGLAGAFGFSGDDSDKRCSILSGGEKARLVLARMLFDPPNLLVLDEPTNHLDMDTKLTLVKALSTFEGTMIFVSHDRDFLSALSNRVLEVSPGQVRKYGGGYRDYVVETGREAPGVN